MRLAAVSGAWVVGGGQVKLDDSAFHACVCSIEEGRWWCRAVLMGAAIPKTRCECRLCSRCWVCGAGGKQVMDVLRSMPDG